MYKNAYVRAVRRFFNPTFEVFLRVFVYVCVFRAPPPR